jgi:hypothetical protein
MKFSSLLEKQLFLVEINRFDLLSIINEDYVPEQELIDEFIKRRSGIISPIRDFRKSQAQKKNWREKRPEYMKAIKKFHKSTEGKKMHRNLGRFLATRLTRDKDVNEKIQDLSIQLLNISEILKTISSYKTHLYIELEYYKSPMEQLILEELIFETTDILSNINETLLNFKELNDTQLDFLIFIVPKEILIRQLKESNSELDESKFEQLDYLMLKDILVDDIALTQLNNNI